jgi:hypothetical protein
MITAPRQIQNEYVIEILGEASEASGIPAAELEEAVLVVLAHIAHGLEHGHPSVSASGLYDAVESHRAPRADQVALFDIS